MAAVRQVEQRLRLEGGPSLRASGRDPAAEMHGRVAFGEHVMMPLVSTHT